MGDGGCAVPLCTSQPLMLAYAFSALREQTAGWRTSTTPRYCAAITERACHNSNEMPRAGVREPDRSPAPPARQNRGPQVREIAGDPRRQLVCSYDEFSVDTTMNLIRRRSRCSCETISKARKKSLKKLMVFFADVREIDLHTVDWNMRYDRAIAPTAC